MRWQWTFRREEERRRVRFIQHMRQDMRHIKDETSRKLWLQGTPEVCSELKGGCHPLDPNWNIYSYLFYSNYSRYILIYFFQFVTAT